RAALALAREVERRAPTLATSKWWKEERHGVFVDYNQNAKDRTVASAYSVRPTPDARVSAPLSWDEVDNAEPADFTLATMPKRFAKLGDRHAGIDRIAGSLEGLLELSARQERDGLGDAPWPPHYKKQRGEPPRVQPSRARGAGARAAKYPLIEIGRAKRKQDALAGLKRWKARHPKAAKYLEPADVLVDAQRLPGEVLARAPATLPAGHAADLRIGLRPRAPGVLLQRVLAQRLELPHELLAHGHRERRGHADVLQLAAVIVEAEEQRAD